MKRLSCLPFPFFPFRLCYNPRQGTLQGDEAWLLNESIES
jgi:hypothetical protein